MAASSWALRLKVLFFHGIGNMKLEAIMFVALLAGAFAASAHAACVRFDSRPNTSPIVDFDGPGSFGELQDTVTLDCLRYVGSIITKGQEHVLIKDDRGKVHTLSVGSYMGENTGVITRIDDSAIYIRQMIFTRGEQSEVTVKFNK